MAEVAPREWHSVLDDSVTRIMSGDDLSRDAARSLARAAGRDQVAALAAAASRVREKYRGRRASLCALVNAKCGACSEDCAFCAQSARYPAEVEAYGFLGEDEIVRRARELEATGCDHVGVVMSGRGPADAELKAVCRAAERIRKETRLNVCCSLGIVAAVQVRALKDAGVKRYNHNLETSEAHFPKVCTTHRWKDRYESALAIKRGGLELCCGGILGLGESPEDRLDLAFSLRELEPDSVPVNLLNPRPGTPLGDAGILTALEAVKYVAVFRLVLPRKIVKLAGGREVVLRSMQASALLAGADGIIVGGYLTTSGQSAETDLEMLRDCGFERGETEGGAKRADGEDT